MFSTCIANSTVTSTGIGVADIAKMEHEVALDSGGEDPQLTNLIGDDGTAIKCAGNKGMREKLEVMRTWFESGSSERKAIDRVLGVNEGEDKVEKGVKQGRKSKRRFRDSDEETSDDDEDDEKGRTAHALFADAEGDSQKWWLSSPISPDGLQKHAKGEEPKSSPLNVHVVGKEKSCQRELSSPTPICSPVRVSSSPLTIPWDPSSSEVNASKRVSTPLLDVNNFQDDRLASSQHRKRRRIEREETLDNTRSPAPGTFSRPVMITSQRRQSQDPLFSSNVTVLKPPPHSSEHPSPNLRRTRSTVENALPPDNAADEEVQRRRAFRIERLKMAERLSRARPDLVDPSYPHKRARLLSRHVKAEASAQYAAAVARQEEAQGDFSYGCGDEGDGGIDWERSRELAKGVREGLERGVHMRSLLPTLQCLESQSPSREE
jgi:DNA cross-link repair 1C protein